MGLPRMLCRIINEAAFAITEDIASPQDIDTALKLGVNFPFGPIEWAEKIGIETGICDPRCASYRFTGRAVQGRSIVKTNGDYPGTMICSEENKRVQHFL